MVKVYTKEELPKLVGEISRKCALELLKEGKYGKKTTKADFRAHKECIRRKFEQMTKERIARLTG